MSYGAADTVGLQNLRNAKAAGLIGDAYFFPCKGSIKINHIILKKRLLQLKYLNSTAHLLLNMVQYGLMLNTIQAVDADGVPQTIQEIVNFYKIL